MKTITNLIQGKKDPNMVNLYLDGEYYTNIPIDFVVEYNLKKGVSISDGTLALIDNKRLEAKAYVFLLRSVTRKTVSVHDMRQKLFDREYPVVIVDNVINKALEYGYLDDDYYTKLFVEQNIKTKGSLRIKADLKRHGISDSLISKYLVGSDEEREGARKEAEKYASRLDLNDAKDKNKLIRHMQYKGYKWEIISSVLSEIMNED